MADLEVSRIEAAASGRANDGKNIRPPITGAERALFRAAAVKYLPPHLKPYADRPLIGKFRPGVLCAFIAAGIDATLSLPPALAARFLATDSPSPAYN